MMRLFNPILVLLLMSLITLTTESSAQEISFWETFALSEDRSKTLQQLVPGSEDFYFFRCLHAQNESNLAEVDTLLKRWIKRHGRTEQALVIENRQALLKYGEDPQETLDYLQRQLNLDFNHRRRIPRAQKDLPTALNPNLIAPDKLIAKCLKQDSNRLSPFSDDGLYLLVDRALNPRQRRDLLKRLTDPTFPEIVDLIVKDLKAKDSKPFGNLNIHQLLTQSQLKSLAQHLPPLLTQQAFVNEYLLRLQPSADNNVRFDAKAHRKYLNSMWEFVSELNPNFNSLKINVLYRLLELDWREGKPNRKRFIRYLQLPRNVAYINRKLTDGLRKQSLATLSENFSHVTQSLPINRDEDLVLDYLHHFLGSAANPNAFADYFEGEFLKRQFATAKILSGNGDRESWASMLSPSQYQSLLERIDLDFAATNEEFFDVDEVVELELFTKNVDKLIVKVFEINTYNFYRKQKREVDTDISLDGLVANQETLYEYDDAPLLRTSRKFKFEDLNKRGVYVIDFIGGGKSSRALIRKGRLKLVGAVTPIGQRLNVVNEAGSLVLDASVTVGSRSYTADEDSNIELPFSTQDTDEKVIVSQGDFSCLHTLQPVKESYSLTAAFHVDRESLAQGNEATVVIRPALSAAGNPIPLKRLESCKLEITSTSIDGVTSTKTISSIAVSEVNEATATFLVPPRLEKISFRLEATLKTLLKQTQTLSAAKTFTINQIDSTELIQDLHLLPTNAGWFVEVRGKTGEIRPGQPVRFRFNVAGLKQPVDVDLQSDDKGQIALGDLGNVDSLDATIAGGSKRHWNPNPTRMHWSGNYHILGGESLSLPLPGAEWELERKLISLLEVRGNKNVRDCFENLAIKDQHLDISNLQPGDYRLTVRSNLLDSASRQVNIRVTDGKPAGKALVGKHRVLRSHSPTQPFASAAAVVKDKLTINIADASDTTRVHIFPVRYLEGFDPFQNLSLIHHPEPWLRSTSIRKSAYMAGRTIGEEYQYILNRRYAARFPGNMLPRPSLLINPWAVQDTQNTSVAAAAGEPARQSGIDRQDKSKKPKSDRRCSSSDSSFANLDFLGGGQDAIVNLRPNDEGQIELVSEQIGNAQAIRIVVVDLFSVAQTQILRQPQKLKVVDQRLADALDPEEHFRQARQIELLAEGETLLIEDPLSAQFQSFDELSDLFGLYVSLGNDGEKLRKFSFVLGWPDLSTEEKGTLYSKYACHELNFFIYQKDKTFFKNVVRKHILNKREGTFLDQWLLEKDLSAWLEPWRFQRLNIVEKILLSQRLEDRRADLVRHVGELYQLSPTPRKRYDELYRFSLMSRKLDGKKLAQLSKKQLGDSLEEEKLAELDADIMAGVMGGGGISGDMGGGMGGRGFDDSFGAPADAPVVLGTGVIGKGSGIRMKQMRNLEAQKRSAGRFRNESRTRSVNGATEIFNVPVERDETGQIVLGRNFESRDLQNQLYRRIEPTREWIENNYYELLPVAQNSGLVTVNQFWKDYANHKDGSFASPWFAEANRNFTEMMFALAVIDLPMDAVEENFNVAEGKLTITAAGPMIVLHQQNRAVDFIGGGTSLLVSENFFQANDRYRYDDGVQIDKFVDGDFLADVLYGAEVVITNPTSTPLAIDLLLQIPQGAMPVNGTYQTRSISMQLGAFSTQKIEYAFYFPAAGEFTHYPAHVSSAVKVLAVAAGVDFHVVAEPESVDEDSWAWVSQNGSDDDVIGFLNRENIQRLDVAEIAYRMKDKAFFKKATETLRSRFLYDHTLWAYSVKHNDAEAIGEFLDHEQRLTSKCGMALSSPLLTIDPFSRNWYQQREFSPLINSRVHQLGADRKILNDRIDQQYEKLMQILGHRGQLDSDNRLVVTYYLLLQDRIDEALQQFAKIESKDVVQTIPYAYCDAYLDLYREKPAEALRKAEKWVDYPVDRWREKFENVVAMVKEIQSGSTTIVDDQDRTRQQDQLASEAPGYDFRIESAGDKRGAGKGIVQWRNLDQLTVNYYEMDIEFLFSSNPFARDQMDGFSMIRPNLSKTVNVKKDASKGVYEFDLPAQFDNKNVLVEVVSGGDSRSQSWFANSMEVQIIESYGQVLLSDPEANSPISKAYVKVFAKGAGGAVTFHKDGYTDLRGRFDYVTQSNQSLDGISEYAILIISDGHGAVIREAKPPRE